MKIYSILFLFLALPFVSIGQINIKGTILDETGQGIPGAVVSIHELNKITVTTIDGGFFFSSIQKGRYHIHVESMGYESFALDTVISTSIGLEIRLQPTVNELEEVVIEIGKQDQKESSVELRKVEKEELEENSSPSLAETLEHIEGVQTQNLGVSVAKPVVRGLRNNRVLIVSDNIRQEEQQWGDDHGMAIDQFGVDEATIIRGPAALIYGSDAIGGVIKLDKNIHLAKNTSEADVTTFYRSVNNTIGVSAGVKLNKNDSLFAFRIGMADYGDYKVPTDSYSYLGYKLPIYDNKLKNTAGREYNASLIVGKNTKWGYTKLTFSDYYQKVGVFSGATGLPAFYSLTPDGDRNIDLPYQEVNHFKAVSESNILFKENWLELVVGYQNNHRKEYGLPRASGFPYDESNNLANDLLLQTITTNVTYHVAPVKKHEDVIGVQLNYQFNKTAGFDYVLPNYQQFNSGMYLLRKWRFNEKTILNAGLRFDYTSLNTEATYTPFYHQLEYKQDILRTEALRNNYLSWAGNIGLSKQINEKHSYKINFGKSFRAPQTIELTSNGAHAGTFRFEKGNPNLKPENAYQLDFTYNFENKKHHFTLTPFINYFDNYIYLTPSNVFPKENIDGEFLPYPETGQMYVYQQNQAIMSGGEILYHYHPKEWLKTGVQFDGVFAQNIEANRPLPMIPPVRGKVFLSFIKKHDKEKSYLTINFTQISAQNRVDKNEKTTAGYSLVNLELGTSYKRFELKIHVQNLTNTNYLKHLSLYRQLNVPEPTTNINVLLKYNIH
jgi:iron complex outermembrane receptor protein